MLRGDFKIHTFTGPGTFCVSSGGNAGGSNSVEYIVVAGALVEEVIMVVEAMVVLDLHLQL